MMLIDNSKLPSRTIVQIGKDLGILAKEACLSEENISKVINSTRVGIELVLPTYVVSSSVKGAEFKLDIK